MQGKCLLLLGLFALSLQAFGEAKKGVTFCYSMDYCSTPGSWCVCPSTDNSCSGNCGIKYCSDNSTTSDGCSDGRSCCTAASLQWCPDSASVWQTDATFYRKTEDFANNNWQPAPDVACVVKKAASVVGSRYCVANSCSDPGANYACSNPGPQPGDGPCPSQWPVKCDIASLIAC